MAMDLAMISWNKREVQATNEKSRFQTLPKFKTSMHQRTQLTE